MRRYPVIINTKQPYLMEFKSTIVSFSAWLDSIMKVDNDILHHLAVFQLHKIDLSNLTLDNQNTVNLLESGHSRMDGAFLDG